MKAISDRRYASQENTVMSSPERSLGHRPTGPVIGLVVVIILVEHLVEAVYIPAALDALNQGNWGPFAFLAAYVSLLLVFSHRSRKELDGEPQYEPRRAIWKH